MSLTDRAGGTLLELLLALVIGGVVVTIALAADGALHRQLRSRGERVGAAGSLRFAAAALERDLSSLGSDSISGPDWEAGAGGLVLRADRGLWVACRIEPGAVVLAADRLLAWRGRALSPGRDSLLLALAPDSSLPAGWQPVPLAAGPFSDTCPAGDAGLRFTTAIDSGLVATRLRGAASARAFESVEYRPYASATSWYLGLELRSAGAVIQPLAGPLAGATGLEWSLVDRTGAPAAGPAAAGIAVVIRALARREVGVGMGRVAESTDSLRWTIGFRNAP